MDDEASKPARKGIDSEATTAVLGDLPMPAPLTDPLLKARPYVTALSTLWLVGAFLFSVAAGAPLIGLLLVGANVCLLMAVYSLAFPHTPTDVLYLRSFRLEERDAGAQRVVRLALQPDLRFSGIRAPRHRTSLFMKLALMWVFALRYANSCYLALEAGDDWPARVWASLVQSRAAVIDLREVTDALVLEIGLALRSLGPKRVLSAIPGPLCTWHEVHR